MQVKTLLFYLMRTAWQVFAVTLVLLAVLVSVLKYTLPYANDYKQDIETLAYEQFGVDMAIGSISASWQGNGPALVLEGLSFADNETSPIALEIDNTSISVNLVESLKSWQFKSNYFVMSGLSAKVDASRFNNSGGDFEQQALLEGLFLGETGHFEVRESRLQIRLADNRKRELLIDSLRWQNQPSQHRGYGKIGLPGISEGEFIANLELTGHTFQQVAGDIFLSARGVDIATWLEPWLSESKVAFNTDINAQAWLSLEEGRIHDATVQWLPSFLRWQENKIKQELSLESGEVVAFQLQEGWKMAASPWRFSFGGRDFPELAWEAYKQQKDTTIWLKSLDIALVTKLAEFMDQEALNSLIKLQPVGMVKAARLNWQNSTDWTLFATTENFGWQNVAPIPGVQGLDVEINAKPNAARVTINSEDEHLLTGNLFSKALNYQQLHAVLEFHHEELGWRLSSRDIWLANDELTLAAELGIDLFGSNEVALYLEIAGGNGVNASNYFPLPVMDADLVAYLKGAIRKGQNKLSQVLLSGELSDFPFASRNGQFEVKSQLEEVEFLFAPDWPAVQDAEVFLDFSDEKMTISAERGTLLNLAIDQPVIVSIADLMHVDKLYVDIDKQLESSQLPVFFAKTPLSTTLNPVFDVIKPTGSIDGEIRLSVDLESGRVDAGGIVNFTNNNIDLQQPGMSLTAMNGQLSFFNEKLKIEKLAGQWRSMPIKASLDADSVGKNYVVSINSQLQTNANELNAVTQSLTESFIDGSSPLKTDITLNFTPNGFNYKAHSQADLVGYQIALPKPYAKQRMEALPLTVNVQGDDISNLITAQLGNELYFNGILDNQLGKLSKANIILGSKNTGLTNDELAVIVHQQTMQLEPWFPFLDKLIEVTSQPSEAGLFPALALLSGEIDNLEIGPLPFTDVQFNMQPAVDGYNAKVTAKELRTQVNLPPYGSSRPISVAIDYLRLLPDPDFVADNLESKDLDWLTRIPAVAVTCNDCKINQYQLDKVNLSLFGDGRSLMVPELFVDKGEHVLRGDAKWHQGITTFNGRFESKDIGELFDEYDITTTVKDSTADIGFNLEWQGAPYNLDVPTLGGEVKWKLGEGHLTEISDGGARVFSLLSLDSLVRKLKLDFRDVFSKGFFYNQMSGSMQLKSGIAYTQDTKLDGVPADLTIKGYANLQTKAIEYDLSVAPQVTSSLPVIVAWMVNPVSGLAALALDKVIHSARVISEIRFKVSGNMGEPIVTEIDRKSREVELPQAAQSQPPIDEPKQEESPPEQQNNPENGLHFQQAELSNKGIGV